jgi:hypothetical protein
VKRDQRKLKRHLGGAVPFGDRAVPTPPKGAELIPVPEEQEAIKRMVKKRRAGASLRAIAGALESEGFKLSHMGVGRMIQAQEATGDHRYG